MRKILIVAGLAGFIRREESILNRADFELHTATSAEDALALHRQKKMDLILAELNMPGMSGEDLVRAIRQDPALREVSIIMVCHQKKEDLERCAAMGANDYVTRPIDRMRLTEKVARLLDVPQRRTLRVLVKVSVKGASNSESFFGTTNNISTAGILLETPKTLAKGDAVTCSFFIPESRRIETEAEVARVVKDKNIFRYGMRFLNMPEDSRKMIENFVRKSYALGK